MGMGGNPYGPAGTGKTESVKALGGLFGRQVLVFNCDEVSSNIFTHCETLNKNVNDGMVGPINELADKFIVC